MIWGAAGIGIAVGAGFYLEAFVGVALLIISVEFIPFLMKLFGPKQLRRKELMLNLQINNKEYIDEVIGFILKKRYVLRRIRIKDLDDGDHSLQLLIAVDFRESATSVYSSISNLEGIHKVEIESMG